MAIRKCWSSTVGARRGTRVRVYERTPGSVLYCAVWVPGRGVSRRSLGHTDRARAVREAAELALLRTSGARAGNPPLMLGALCARYLREMTHARDGSLKTAQYRSDCAQRGKRLVQWFGEQCDVSSMTPDRLREYVRARRAGAITGTPVRTRSVQADLVLLKTILRWATGVFDHGHPLLDRNPLGTFAIPHERDPKRPLIDARAVGALLAVADQVNGHLPLLIVLMDSTGRRLRSVLGLRWDDFDFDQRTIHWRPELDKRRCSWRTPMPQRAEACLVHARTHDPRIGSALVFPSLRNTDKPVSVYVASAWLKRAFVLAGVPKPDGGLWHCFRRKWATERKAFPLRDVAAAGGWSDVQTLLTCYQHPDAETLRAVMDYPGPAPAGTTKLTQKQAHLS